MNRLLATENIEAARQRRGIAPSAYSRDAVGYYHDSRDVLSREQRRQMDEEEKESISLKHVRDKITAEYLAIKEGQVMRS